MGKRAGKPAKEPTTDSGKPWSKMTGAEKGAEFDASLRDPGGYAMRNFKETTAGEGGKGFGAKARHKKPKKQ